MALRCSGGMNLQALVETYLYNFLNQGLTQMGVTECLTWKQLKQQGEHVGKLLAKT